MIHVTVLTRTLTRTTVRRTTVPAADVATLADAVTSAGHVILRGWYYSDSEKTGR